MPDILFLVNNDKFFKYKHQSNVFKKREKT